MDRVFLDANVLFSATYREGSGLTVLWRLDGVHLLTSEYALNEARRNLTGAEALRRLERLRVGLEVVSGALQPAAMPTGVDLAADDVPILLAAAGARATHLLTGDVRHFAPLLGRRTAGALVQRPAQYLADRTAQEE